MASTRSSGATPLPYWSAEHGFPYWGAITLHHGNQLVALDRGEQGLHVRTEAWDTSRAPQPARSREQWRTLGEPPYGWYRRYGPSSNTRRRVVGEGGFLYDGGAYSDQLPYHVLVSGAAHILWCLTGVSASDVKQA